MSPSEGVDRTQSRVMVRSGLRCGSESREMTNPNKGKEVSAALFVGKRKGISPSEGVDETQSRVVVRSDLLCGYQSMTNPIKGKEVSTALFVGKHNGISPIKGVDRTQSRVIGLLRSVPRVPTKEND